MGEPLPPTYSTYPEKTNIGYGGPQSSYAQQPQPGYSQPQPGYSQPQSGYSQPQPGYSQTQPGYGQPQPAYNPPPPGPAWNQPPPQQQMMSNTTVVMQSAPQPTVVMQNTVRPDDCLVCSILNLVFCNLLFGAIAVAFSCMARDAYDRGAIEQGRSHAKVAKAMNIVGPLVTVFSVVAVVVYVVVVVGSAVNSYTSYSRSSSYYYG